MANRFPAYTTNASFSAPTQPYLSLGGEQVGRAYQQVGQAGLNLSADVYVRQGQVQIAEFGAETQADLRAMYNKLEKTTNEDEYDAIFEQTWEGIQARSADVSNGWARRRISLALPEAREKQLGLVQEAKKKRIADKEEFQYIKAANDAIATGNTQRVATLLSSRVQAGSMTAEEARAKLGEIQQKAAASRIEQLATSDPERVLSWTTETMQQDVPGARGTHLKYAKDLAKSVLNDRMTIYDKRWNGVLEDTLGKAQDTDTNTFRAQLLARQDLNNIEKDEVMRIYLASRKRFQDTGVNPWAETINPQLRDETAVGIINGDITTLGELNAAWTKDNQIQFSVYDRDRLLSIYNSKHGGATAKYTWSDPRVKIAYELVENEFRLRDDKGNLTVVPANRLADYTAALSRVDAMLKDPGIREDQTGRLADEVKKVLSEYRQQEAEDIVGQSWFGRALETIGESAKYPGPMSYGAQAQLKVRSSQKRKLTKAIAKRYLQRAGGDVERAKEMAQADGYTE